MTTLGLARKSVNAGLRPLGVQVIRGRSTDPAVQRFLSARKTIAAARRAGLSIGDYIDQVFAQPGATAAAVETVVKLGELKSPVKRICEIGAGSGRYMEKFIEALHPEVYEVYETADDWLPHLRSFPHVVTHSCDGRTLKGTVSGSVDLVHAQKVFVYLDFWTMVSYLTEMVRVIRPGGVIAFDIISERALDEVPIDQWMTSGQVLRPAPRQWVIDLLARESVCYQGNDFISMPPGRSELLVFRKE
jgi:SAM-dependent methyltransferase